MHFEWDINPEITTLFNTIPIRYYSILFMLGLAFGFIVVKKIWLKESLPLPEFDRLWVYVFFATLIGARLGHCLFYEPSYFLSHPLEMLLPFNFNGGKFNFTGFQGLASHGGILAVFIAVYIFSKKSNINFLSITDKVSIGGSATAVFIRLGNFMNSEIIGKATNAKYGVIFKKVDNVLRHPSQLYEAIAYFIIFCVLLFVYKKKKNRQDGFIFGLFFTLLFIARFIIEYTKINQVAFESEMAINMGQVLSLPFILVGLSFMIVKAGPKKDNTAHN